MTCDLTKNRTVVSRVNGECSTINIAVIIKKKSTTPVLNAFV